MSRYGGWVAVVEGWAISAFFTTLLSTVIFFHGVAGYRLPHDLTDEQLELTSKIATCRAHCVDGFGYRLAQLTNKACSVDPDCLMCWENCEMFYRSFHVWGSICEEPAVCFDGCQLACSVYHNGVNLPDHRMLWSFPSRLRVVRLQKESRLEVEWDQPVPMLPIASPLPHMVYVLFAKMARKSYGWFPLNHTISTRYLTRNPRIVKDAQDFLVIAFNRDGKAAVVTPTDNPDGVHLLIKGQGQSQTVAAASDPNTSSSDRGKQLPAARANPFHDTNDTPSTKTDENVMAQLAFILSTFGAVVASSLALTLAIWQILRFISDQRRRRSLTNSIHALNALRFTRKSDDSMAVPGNISIGAGESRTNLLKTPILTRVHENLIYMAAVSPKLPATKLCHPASMNVAVQPTFHNHVGHLLK